MLITEIENAIIAHLKSKIPDLSIESFPDNPSSYRLIHPKGAILVRFRGDRYSSPQSLGVVVQDRTVEFELIIVTRNLRSHAGAYAYIDAVRLAMTGFNLPGCKKFYLTRSEFIDEEDGIWQHGVTVATNLPNAELAEDEILPLLKMITLEDEYGTLEVNNP